MVARGCQRTRRVAEDGLAVVLHLADLAVHDLGSANYLAAESRSQRLVSQADSQNRFLAGKVADQFNADARLLRRTRAGRDHDVAGLEGFDLLGSNLIVAANLDRLT